MRYDQLLHAIDLFKPRVLLEVGTWSGDNAIRMIRQAQKHYANVEYYGYDLFETATEETDRLEFNVKHHNAEQSVREHILKHCPGAFVALIKGNTRETLKTFQYADFAYIDGGHSIETIENDYQCLAHVPVIIFDDYYSPENGNPDISKVGCNSLVDKMTGTYVLPDFDPVKGGGKTGFVLKV